MSTEQSAVVEMAMQPAGEPKALPLAVSSRNINRSQWNTLCRSLYPGANPASVVLVIDYCAARKLDPMKKPCHIVPMQVKDARTNTYEWRDVVMPGIYEYRTTAQRTGEYLGHSKPTYGPMVECAGVTAPEWCELTTYRWNPRAQARVEFPVQVFFREVVATKRDGQANERWKKAPIQMLTKCTEAAALREAFPDELGGETTAEEMDGRIIETQVTDIQAVPPPAGFDDFVATLESAAVNGAKALGEAWERADPALRLHMAQRHADHWTRLQATAAEVDAMPEGGAEA